MSKQYDFGLIGLGTMGKNLLMNIADQGCSVVGYDQDSNRVEALNNETTSASAFSQLDDFVSSLSHPRKIMLLVPAGQIVDSVIGQLLPLLEKGDILMDGGNTFFQDTERRQATLKNQGIHYLSVGISGGAEGARHGPSMMPSGDLPAYQQVEAILSSAAAKVDGHACVTYLGEGGVGNYVKMVHNGIEYGLMQILAEAYDIMKRGMSLSNAEIEQVFAEWNEGKLQSYLVEILSPIFCAKDDETGKDLIDLIVDKAKQKGTGKWTSQEAFNVGEPVPSIDFAVIARMLSGLKEQRVSAKNILNGPRQMTMDKGSKAPLRRLKNATYFSFLMTYAQGMALLKSASREYGYDIDLADVASVWQGGCIIRANLLKDIKKAYQNNPDLSNLLLDKHIANKINKTQKNARKVVVEAIKAGLPVPCMGASLAYFDSYRSASLPVNLIQAQRDFFGAHTYERTDKAGNFHHHW